MRFLIVLFFSAAVAWAQRGLTISVDVQLVSLDVTVTDAEGNPVHTLTRDDFLIYEDGALQQIQNFSAVDIPYNVLLLFDCSGSTRPQQKLLTAAMSRFTGNLRPQDSIAIAQFGTGVDLRVDWRTRDTGNLDVELGTFAGCDNTDFYSALLWTARKLDGISGRKGVIVYTDGATPMPSRPMIVGGRRVSRPTDSMEDPAFQEILQAVRASGAAFFFVAVDTDLNPLSGTSTAAVYSLQQARARMEQLAEVTGGRIAFPRKADDILPLYDRIGRELGTSYSIGYASNDPATDGRFRSIAVRTRDNTLKIRQSRAGYVAQERN